ncbi:DNA-protecting protein DprA [Motiliproteus coralliicola]|uniref:DNA-protecting protein DprA n=1 Tax=Motiliproteus coralliicola TaxID=2283196 RepID=A0A369W9V5_9GAMM|nr:DNA-processing protein DprA [Motiliproteus coralliicola]RDE18790.1 DNA-protecting protein DprA [Motiliproteus coralliicola]
MPLPYLRWQPQHIDWLRLSQIPRLGPVALKRLWQSFGSADAILSADYSLLLEAGLSDRLARQIIAIDRQQSSAYLEQVDRWLLQPKHSLLCLDDPDYPQSLLAIEDPPPLLYLIGDAELLSQPQIAIVGSRSATLQGLGNARQLARELSLNGLIPTSGMALGIDASAHQGALEGLGLTVAVLGTGVDQCYPKRHQMLATQILDQGGVLLSELPLGTPPRGPQFPRRNRIISGLSLGLLVVEAALKSGSLVSASLALEQGRELFALPGSIHNPQARGCHQLIRQGAWLVDNAEQILQELAPQLESKQMSATPAPAGGIELTELPNLAPAQRQLLEALGYDPVSLDQLVIRTGLQVDQLQSQILALELQGVIASVAGGYQRC